MSARPENNHNTHPVLSTFASPSHPNMYTTTSQLMECRLMQGLRRTLKEPGIVQCSIVVVADKSRPYHRLTWAKADQVHIFQEPKGPR